MSLRVTVAGSAVRIEVHLTPRAARTEVAGLRDGALHVRVHAPPVEGAANEALERFLAEGLGLRRSAVRVVRGAKARRKTVELERIDPSQVEAWAAAATDPERAR